MNRFLAFAWVVVIVAIVLVVGQSLGFYELPAAFRDVRLPIPGFLQRTVGPAIEPSPRPNPSPSAAASPTARSVAAPAAAVATDICTPTAPHFVHGAADLKAALGDEMGTPLECERVIDAAGNTEQQTTTGLVYYRAGANITVFTTGLDHWALTPGGIVRWTGDSVEPPADAD